MRGKVAVRLNDISGSPERFADTCECDAPMLAVRRSDWNVDLFGAIGQSMSRRRRRILRSFAIRHDAEPLTRKRMLSTEKGSAPFFAIGYCTC